MIVAALPPSTSRGAARVQRMRDTARQALRWSAMFSKADLGALDKDERDAPLPSNGWHWSLSHCPTHVAAAVHRAPLGVDVESKREVTAELTERVFSVRERELLGGGIFGFLRGWTAKEAVLKERGLGLSGLSRCKIVMRVGDEVLIDCDGLAHVVQQRRSGDCVVAVSSAGDAHASWFEIEEDLLWRL